MGAPAASGIGNLDTYLITVFGVITAFCVVRILGQIPHEFKEHWRLADKESHGG